MARARVHGESLTPRYEASAFLTHLKYLGVDVTCERGFVFTYAPPGVITEPMRAKLLRLTPELIKILGETKAAN